MRKSILFFLTIVSLMKIFLADGEELKFLASPIPCDDYDMYVFSIQWGGTLCQSGQSNCQKKLSSIPKNIFTLHGLWPSYSNGKKIDSCNTGEEIRIVKDGSHVYTEMETYWLSFTNEDHAFWSHEFNKHGYCYTQKYQINDPKHYFQYALEIYKRHDMARIFQRAFGDISGNQSFEHEDLHHHVERATEGLKYELVCKNYYKKQYLQEVRFFFDLDMTAMDIGRRGSCNPSKPIFIDFQ
jgi:ribonuclease T2